MSRIGYVPKFLSKLNHQRFPVWAIFFNFLIGMLAFLPLPGWQAMVNFLVSAMVITYAMGPIALMSLRLSLPDKERPFRLKAANIICLFAFYLCNLFSYWTGWEIISKLGLVLFAGLILFAISYIRGSVDIKTSDFRSAFWLMPYLLGIVLISYLGAYGGKNLIPFGWDFFIIAIFSFSIYHLAIKGRLVINSEEVNNFLHSESMALEHI
jgi:amino acid transporter